MTLLALGALASLLNAWSHVHDYTVTIDAREVLGKKTDNRVLHYAFRAPDDARLEVISGQSRGGIVVWHGGNQVLAYRRGVVSFVKVHMDARDPRVSTLRGNGVLTPNLGHLLACFDRHRDAVREANGPALDGKPTTAVTLTYDGFTCPDDSAQDRAVTRDVLYVDSNGIPVMRERFEGATLVEHWVLRDVRIDPGVEDSELR